MNNKFLIATLVVCTAVAGLIYSAVSNTAQAVVTVSQLASNGGPRANVRLGARVADAKIDYQTDPHLLVRFLVRDIEDNGHRFSVEYRNAMPDTLKEGRDVIMEGDFDGQTFHAKSLLTQCPSKYEAPTPGANKSDAAYGGTS